MATSDELCERARRAVFGDSVPVRSADAAVYPLGTYGYVADGTTFDAHRPGYRTGDQAAIDAREAAYRHYVQNLENAWKSPAQLAADAVRTEQVTRDAMTDTAGAQ
jgi:hypothetical protein